MKLLFCITILLTANSLVRSQTPPAFGNLPYTDTSEFKNHSEKLLRLNLAPIGKSKNLLELRLYSYADGFTNCKVLSLDSSKWNIATARRYNSVYKLADSFKIKQGINYATIFDSLKANHIFDLPNQRSLGLKGAADHETIYVLVYKAGNTFRAYTFKSPGIYKERNPGVKEVSNYLGIVSTFYTMFYSLWDSDSKETWDKLAPN